VVRRRSARGSWLLALVSWALASPLVVAQDELAPLRQLEAALDDDGVIAFADARLAQQPGDAALLEAKARAHRELGQWREAAAACAAIAAPTPAVTLLHAECLGVGLGRHDEARALLDSVAAAQPDALELRLARVRLLAAEQRFTDAAGELRALLTIAPRRYEGLLLAGQLRARLGAVDEALKAFLPLVEQPAAFDQATPRLECDALTGAIDCLMRRQRWPQARDLALRLAAKLPRRAAVHARLAELHGLVDRPVDALESATTAVELAPKEIDYRLRRAAILRAMGRNDEALAEFAAAAATKPEPPQRALPAELAQADLLLEAGDLAAAQPHADAALALAPDDEQALLLSARLREKAGDAAGAIAALRRALARDPLLFDASYRLARLLARSRDPADLAESKERFARHARIEPRLLDLQRARRELEAAPRSPAALVKLAALLDEVGEGEAATRHVEQALALAPDDVAALALRGCLAANGGDRDGARRRFERARELLKQPRVAAASAVDGGALDLWLALLRDGKELPLPLRLPLRAAK